MDTYKLDETGFFVITSGGDKLDFYEFLSASSFSSADELETKLNVKKRILNYSKNKRRICKSQMRLLAGAEGLEPSARGFGDRCSTN